MSTSTKRPSAGTKTKSIVLKTELPGPKSRALMARREKAVARGPYHSTPVFAASASGALIVDADGNRLIDLGAGIGVANVGHAEPSVVKAVQAQAAKAMHLSFNVTPYENYVEVCEALNRLAPGKSPKKSFLANSGAEAVENAVKIARAHTGRQGVICFEHAFHGRTYLAMTLTYKSKPYKYGFAPLNPEVYRAPFPYPYRGISPEDAYARFEEVALSQVGAQNLAAVILEPVQGEGGFLPAAPSFLKKLRAFCDKHGVVLIADEIQSGFGRTGTLFACEQLGVEPDLLVTAKGLGGGTPLSAVTGKAAIMDGPVAGGIGGTFGGNPLCCAAALEVIRLFEDGGLLARAQKLADTLHRALLSWQERFPVIGDVRGLGPMLAIELVKDRKTKEPHPDAAKALSKYAYEHGVVTLTAGTHANCLRFLPPLVITDEQLAEALGVVEDGLKTL
ncbi:MAG: 4-aminobutyrate--2-oxoglutarate transaminase [Elusimicrobiota bacterium]|nr:4-aminobutyrate--2-oxoglutarate transaminase [Elusimicrobiota bacterium]